MRSSLQAIEPIGAAAPRPGPTKEKWLPPSGGEPFIFLGYLDFVIDLGVTAGKQRVVRQRSAFVLDLGRRRATRCCLSRLHGFKGRYQSRAAAWCDQSQTAGRPEAPRRPCAADGRSMTDCRQQIENLPEQRPSPSPGDGALPKGDRGFHRNQRPFGVFNNATSPICQC